MAETLAQMNVDHDDELPVLPPDCLTPPPKKEAKQESKHPSNEVRRVYLSLCETLPPNFLLGLTVLTFTGPNSPQDAREYLGVFEARHGFFKVHGQW